MQIPNSEAQDILYGENPDWTEVDREHVDSRRWCEVYEVFFRHNDQHFQVCIEVGSTELQEDTPPFGGEDPVEFLEVHQVPKTVMVWEVVSGDDA